MAEQYILNITFDYIQTNVLRQLYITISICSKEKKNIQQMDCFRHIQLLFVANCMYSVYNWIDGK